MARDRKPTTGTAVIIPDIQCPQQDDRALQICLDVIRDIRPEMAIIIGDFVAFDSMSSHSKRSWADLIPTLASDIGHANSLLDTIDASLKQSGVKHKWWLEGNHEDRLTRWLVKNAPNIGDLPELRVEGLLKLAERGYVFKPLDKQPLRIGKLNIIHGYYTSQYHAAKHIRNTARNIIYGHTHDYQAHVSTHLPDEPPHIAMSCGCLCDFSQGYIRNRPTRWIHGFVEVEFMGNGYFYPRFIPIINYMTRYNGKDYTA